MLAEPGGGTVTRLRDLSPGGTAGNQVALLPPNAAEGKKPPSGDETMTRLRALSPGGTAGNQVALLPPDAAGEGPRCPKGRGAPYASRT